MQNTRIIQMPIALQESVMPPRTHQDTVVALHPGVLPTVDVPRGARLVFDLAAIELIDSRLIAHLLAIVRMLRPVAVCFHRPCPRVRVQLAQLGLDRVVPVLVPATDGWP